MVEMSWRCMCGGDELEVYVCLLFRRQVVVGGSRGELDPG